MTSETTRPAKKIGPFLLYEVVGQAGMGVVWRGIHEEQQVPIAVKFLTEEGARDPLYLGCLKNEVRKVASLEHPAIIHVHDHGEVPQDLGIESLAPGSPYLVMEYAEGGTLSRHCGNLEWDQIWRVLMRLLDGLAHAHARGVVHRDIKPGNVLLRRASGGVVLTDFGLARAGDTENGPVLNAGTPSYMAPEQILQKAYEIGPWTDMYGLGCLAWSLACGKPPFQADSIDALLNAHLHEPVPRMEPVTEVPKEFENWIRKLLRKDPHQRFVRAADAAYVLSKMAQPDESETLYIEPVFHVDSGEIPESMSLATDKEGEETTAKYDDTQVMDPREVTDSKLKPAALPKVGKSLLWADRGELAPFPEDWRAKHPPRQIRHLLGTGLALYGLRNFPVVGRVDEQNRLWGILGTTRTENSSRCVVIQGADGTGKTHLSEWLARRAYEVGAAIVLRAGFDDGDDDAEPLVGLIRSLLSTDGMDRESAETQVRSALEVLGHADDTEVEALLSVLGPFPGETYSPQMMEERQDVRFPVIRRILHRFSLLRPVIVLLDEVHRSDESLAFARVMMSEQSIQHPVLLVMTANTVNLTDSYRDQFQPFMRKKRVDSIKLGPLAAEHRSGLVRKLLGLEPELAALVERRSGGNPQFAVQLVGDWIQKGHLVQGEGGFSLRAGIQPEFPADLQAVWERRLAAALPLDRDIRCLQLAADLGMEVDPKEWAEACEHAGTTIDAGLIEILAQANIVEPRRRGSGWSFTHSLVRESLKRQAEFEGTRVAHHVAVAEMLSTRKGVEGRLGRHLYHAGRLEEAVEVLLRGAERYRAEGRRIMSIDMIALREKALKKLEVPLTDVRWAEGWMVREYFYGRRKNFAKAKTMLEQVLEYTEGVPEAWMIRAKAWRGLGGIYRLMGYPEEARHYLNKALQNSREDKQLLTTTLNNMGVLELTYGNLVLAAQFFEGALKYADQTGDEEQQYRVLSHMAGVHRRQGNIEIAHDYLTRSLAYYRRSGAKQQQARCLNDMAELDRLSGNTEAAEEGYRQAVTLQSAIGDQSFSVASLNLGLIYAETGRPIEARSEIERAQTAVRLEGLANIEGLTMLVLGHIHVQLGNIDEWQRCFTSGRDLIEETGFFDVDVARTAQLGGEALLAIERPEEARISLEFAHGHWKSLEREDKCASVAEVLAQID